MINYSNMSLPGVSTAPATSQRNPNQSQGWLLELERAQAGLLKQEQGRDIQRLPRVSQDGAAAVEQIADQASHGMQSPAPFSAWHPAIIPAGNGGVAQAASIDVPAQEATVSNLPGARLVAAGIAVSASAEKPHLMAAEVPPENGDALPGRQEDEAAKATVKLLRTSDESLDLAVRDPSITLESELRLVQQVRTALRSAGTQLGKVWVNGRVAFDNSLGDKHGD